MRAADADDELLGPARLAFYTPVREYPPLGDRKASALLAAYGLMVSVLLVFLDPIALIVMGPIPLRAGLALVVLTPLAVLILVGAWYAFRALTLPIPTMPTSMAFYGHIAGMPRDEYRDRVGAADHREALRWILHYNYSLAVLSERKFRLVGRSMGCLRATFGLWISLLLLVSLSKCW